MAFDELIKAHRERILTIASKHGAHNVRVFGSTVRGESKPGSDLDLLVEFDPSRSLTDLSALKIELEETLGCPVDIVEPEALHWVIREDVLREAVPL